MSAERYVILKFMILCLLPRPVTFVPLKYMLSSVSDSAWNSRFSPTRTHTSWVRTFKMAHRFADESVDDSEPEREAIRRRVSAKRALKESRTTRLPANGMIHVIELTDDESDKGVAPSKLSIINISGEPSIRS